MNSLVKTGMIKHNKIIKNIFGLGVFQVLGLLANFLLLGLIYRYFSNEELYGLWLTIFSVLSYIYLFDFGIGNGLRNKLTESISNGDMVLSSKYVSTSYFIMIIPTIIIILGIAIVSPIINWGNFFNINKTTISEEYLSLFIWIVFSLFAIQFYLTLINSILHSLFKSYLVSVIGFVANVLNIIIVSVLYFLNIEDMLILGIVYLGSSIIILSLTTYIIFFKSRENELYLSIRYFDKSLIKPLLNIGLHFLMLQFAIIILFNTANLLISRYIGVSEVTSYQLTNKLMSLFTIGLGFILTPVWSILIEYNAENNNEKIKKVIKRIFYVFVILTLGVIIIGFFTPFIIGIWVGSFIEVNKSLIIFMAIFTVLHMWCNIFQNILNGLNRISIQVIAYGIASIINIPISIFLIEKYSFGVIGIIVGTITALLVPAIILPFYTIFLFRKGNLSN